MQNKQSGPVSQKTRGAGRAAGVFLMLLCGVASYFTIVQPLLDMLNGKPYVSYSMETIVMISVGFLFGLVLAILGQDGLNSLLGSPQETSGRIRFVVFLIVILAIVFGCIWAWNSVVNMLGYG